MKMVINLSKTISTRLSADEVKELESIAEKEKLDRSSLIRKYLLQKMEEYRVSEYAELYKKGVVSLQEGATQAHVSIYAMMDYIRKEGIRPPVQSQAEFNEELKESMEYLSHLK